MAFIFIDTCIYVDGFTSGIGNLISYIEVYLNTVIIFLFSDLGLLQSSDPLSNLFCSILFICFSI